MPETPASLFFPCSSSPRLRRPRVPFGLPARKEQGIIRESRFSKAVSGISGPESSHVFRGLRPNFLLVRNREVNSADQGLKSDRTGKELGRTGKCGFPGPNPVQACVGPVQRLSKRRSCITGSRRAAPARSSPGECLPGSVAPRRSGRAAARRGLRPAASGPGRPVGFGCGCRVRSVQSRARSR